MRALTAGAVSPQPRGRRIAIVDAYPSLMSGSQKAAGQLARALTTRGWIASVVLPADGVTGAALRKEGVDVAVVDAPSALMGYGGRASVWQLLRSLFAAPRYWARVMPVFRRADVVWVNDLRGMVLAAVPARLTRRPVVWHLHAAQPQLTWLIPVMARLARRVVVPSIHARQGLRESAVEVLSLPVELPAVAWSDPHDADPLIVSVGRLYRAKGFDVLLEAVARLRADGRAFRVAVVGGASSGHDADAAELHRRRADLDLVDVVEFVGAVDDVQPFLLDATVYVQPSRAETFGLAAQEALSLGLPVVVSAAGGLRDRVVDGVTGLWVPPGDAGALAHAMQRLLDDDELRAQLGRAARKAAAGAASFESFALQAEALCLDVLGRRAAS